ncbi:MAG: hypothetical protein NT001_06400 [Candidatus Woesearchaeota archaeon]|nr:hypothetical protein [Candidatus Woesearchaeota archaeon]
MNKKAQQLGVISGGIATLGVIFMVVGALLNWTWLIYVGVVLLICGIVAYKFMGV